MAAADTGSVPSESHGKLMQSLKRGDTMVFSTPPSSEGFDGFIEVVETGRGRVTVAISCDRRVLLRRIEADDRREDAGRFSSDCDRR